MQNRAFSLIVLGEKFGICRLDPSAPIPKQVYQSSFFSITRTPDELSIVCNEMHIPKAHRCNRGWRCLQIKGPLDLSETGILSALSRSLAEAEIPMALSEAFLAGSIHVRRLAPGNGLAEKTPPRAETWKVFSAQGGRHGPAHTL